MNFNAKLNYKNAYNLVNRCLKTTNMYIVRRKIVSSKQRLLSLITKKMHLLLNLYTQIFSLNFKFFIRGTASKKSF